MDVRNVVEQIRMVNKRQGHLRSTIGTMEGNIKNCSDEKYKGVLKLRLMKYQLESARNKDILKELNLQVMLETDRVVINYIKEFHPEIYEEAEEAAKNEELHNSQL